MAKQLKVNFAVITDIRLGRTYSMFRNKRT